MSDTRSPEPSSPVVTAESGALLDRLQALLQRQLELVHQGNLAAATELFDQTGRCVREIVNVTGGNPARYLLQDGARPGLSNLAQQWHGIRRLYQELGLVLTAQRAEVAAGLNAIRQSKKVLNTYSRAALLRR